MVNESGSPSLSPPQRSHWGPRLGWPSCVTRGIDPGLLITWLHWKLTSTINIDLAAISSGESDINLSLPAQSVRRRERRLEWRERKWWWWWWWWSWGKVVLGEWCGAKFSEIGAERLMWFHAEWVVLKDRCGVWIRENFSWGQMWYGVYRDWFWRGQSMGKYVLYGLSRKMTLLNNILRILKLLWTKVFNAEWKFLKIFDWLDFLLFCVLLVSRFENLRTKGVLFRLKCNL